MTSIAIAGVSGYVGGELARLLVNHPQYPHFTIGALTGSSQVGLPVGKVHGHIPQLADAIITETTVDNLRGHDVVFLALPHGTSAQIAQGLSPETMVIDCGADFRIPDSSLWNTYYEGPHAGSWPYGLPEMPGQREKISQSTRVAIPGCYPTAALLGVLPVVSNAVCAPHITITGISGTSGAGRSSNPQLTSAEVLGSISAYNAGGIHRHLAELRYFLSEAFTAEVSVTFTPVLVPTSRGILAVSTVTTGLSQEQLQKLYSDFYRNELCVRVLDADIAPKTGYVLGSNVAQIAVYKDERTGVATIVSAIDNLTKGTAGAAVQCFNLMQQLPEYMGLPLTGLAP